MVENRRFEPTPSLFGALVGMISIVGMSPRFLASEALLCDPRCSHLSTNPTCDGRTDRRTDRHTMKFPLYRVSIARAVKTNKGISPNFGHTATDVFGLVNVLICFWGQKSKVKVTATNQKTEKVLISIVSTFGHTRRTVMNIEGLFGNN